MLDVLSTYHYIIIFISSIIIISYFFNSFSKSSGIPSVLMFFGNDYWDLCPLAKQVFVYFRGVGNSWVNFNSFRRASG